MAAVGEEDRRVVCVADVTGKELSWQDVRKGREREWRNICVTVDGREPTAQYQVTSADTKWTDTNQPFEESSMQIISRIVAREFKSDDRPDPHAGTHPLYFLKSSANFLDRAHRRVTCIVSCKNSETGPGTITSGRQNGCRRGKMGLLTRVCTEHGTQHAIWSV